MLGSMLGLGPEVKVLGPCSIGTEVGSTKGCFKLVGN